jgi:hypothetical protein
MSTSFYWLTLGVLAAWRVSHLLTAESGPWDLALRLRTAAGAGFWGSLFGCFYCLSLWVAAPIAYSIGESWKEQLFLWLSISGGASLLERSSTREGEVPPAPFAEEDEGETDVLRRQ